jgi:hypothetical protein
MNLLLYFIIVFNILCAFFNLFIAFYSYTKTLNISIRLAYMILFPSEYIKILILIFGGFVVTLTSFIITLVNYIYLKFFCKKLTKEYIKSVTFIQTYLHMTYLFIE